MRHAVAMLVVLTALPAAAQIPDAYQVIVRRNIFDAGRGGSAPTNLANHAEAPPPPTETVTLIGVVILDGRPAAMFAGSAPSLAGTRQIGERLGLGQLVAIDTGGVTLQPDDAARFRIGVGQSLKRSAGEPWQTTAERAATSIASERPVATGPDDRPAGAGADEILKRMLERRQRELKP